MEVVVDPWGQTNTQGIKITNERPSSNNRFALNMLRYLKFLLKKTINLYQYYSVFVSGQLCFVHHFALSNKQSVKVQRIHDTCSTRKGVAEEVLDSYASPGNNVVFWPFNVYLVYYCLSLFVHNFQLFARICHLFQLLRSGL